MSNHEKILERVRALMAKAASTQYPEEADAFRSKADQLMTNYAIEAWQVEHAQSKVGARPEPEVRWMNFDWWYRNAFKDQLYVLFYDVAEHCRCRVVYQKMRSEYRGDGDSHYALPAIGLPSDLDWFDLLFTNLMIAMIQKVDPQPNPEWAMEENMAMMREAGLPWNDALNRLALAGVVPSLAAEDAQRRANTTGEEVEFNDEDEYRYDGKGRQRLYFSKKQYESTIRKYRSWCARTGHPQSYVSQVTFRKHFADGFKAEIGDRLWRMQRESRQEYDKTHEAGSMALAVRDINEVTKEKMWEEFPDLKPHPKDCSCARCEARREADRKLAEELAKQKPVKYKPSRRAPVAEKIDYAAIEAGRAAGRSVNLTNKPSERISGNRPGLPDGN